MIDQCAPSKCSIKPLPTPEPLSPTAKQLVVLEHATPLRSADLAPLGVGIGEMDQLTPFQCSANDLWADSEP